MTEFNLILSQDDIEKLSAALGNMPFRVIAPLITKINQQLGKQMSDNAKASVPTPPPPAHVNGAAEQPSA